MKNATKGQPKLKSIIALTNTLYLKGNENSKTCYAVTGETNGFAVWSHLENDHPEGADAECTLVNFFGSREEALEHAVGLVQADA